MSRHASFSAPHPVLPGRRNSWAEEKEADKQAAKHGEASHGGSVSGGGGGGGDCSSSSKSSSMMTLGEMSMRALRARFAVLKAVNRLVKGAVRLVDLTRVEEGSMAYLLAYWKALLFPQVKDALFNTSLTLSAASDDPPTIRLNRGTSPPANRKKERTLLYQMMEVVERKGFTLRDVGGPGEDKQSWICELEGEGGTDYGGLFRESLREMCAELQSGEGSLQLLVQCPNQRVASGSNQDKWLPNPRSKSATEMKMFRLVGKLMGAAIRTGCCLELDLPGLVWKQLVGEDCVREDVAAVDDQFHRDVESALQTHSAGEWEAKRRTWEVRSLAGGVKELFPGGASVEVPFAERAEYVARASQYRVDECEEQIKAIREGLHSVVPSLVLPLLMWRDLEVKVCGRPTIDVERLKSLTEYKDIHGGAEHRVSKLFWKVVSDMSNDDLAALLAFTWGRTRLPVEHSGDHLILQLLEGRGDDYLPQAHTCFFTLDLPEYSSEAVMRAKLLYAIYGCAAIDNDVNNPHGTDRKSVV